MWGRPGGGVQNNEITSNILKNVEKKCGGGVQHLAKKCGGGVVRNKSVHPQGYNQKWNSPYLQLSTHLQSFKSHF